MRELMREIFSDEIPEYELLEPRIREWLNSSDTDLDNLKDDIFEHLQKHISKNSDLRRKDVGPEAMNLSYSAIDGLIENMEVNSVNFGIHPAKYVFVV